MLDNPIETAKLEESKARLRNLINLGHGESWDDRVSRFAVEQGRSRSSVYRWLTSGPPLNVLDAIDYRLTRSAD